MIFTAIQVNAQSYYHSIKSVGNPPWYFMKSAKEKQRELSVKTSPYKEREERISELNFYMSTHYWMNDLLSSGNVIFGEETHQYLNDLLASILKSNRISDSVFIHGIKSSSVNAFATDVGIIFVNFGLMQKVRNEAELAFVICHELSHYLLQHNFDLHSKSYQLEKLGENKELSSYDYILKKHAFSRDIEYQADSLGFALYLQTGYDPSDAVHVFEFLDQPENRFDLTLSDKLISFKQRLNEVDSSKLVDKRKSILVSDIDFETTSTHPATEKRKQKIIKMGSAHGMEQGKHYLVSQERFTHIKEILDIEICQLALSDFDYTNAYFHGLNAYQNYPNYADLGKVTIAKSMIGMLQMKVYDSISKEQSGFPKLSDQKLGPASFNENQLLYYHLVSTEKIIADIDSLFILFLQDGRADEEMKALNSWYEHWKQNMNVKPGKEETDKPNNTCIIVDPFYLTIDTRRQYPVLFSLTEKNQVRLATKIRSSSKIYHDNFISVADKKTLTVANLNETAILNNRVNEILVSGSVFNSFPVNYYEVKELTDKYDTETMMKSYSITARFKRNGNQYFFYILFPLLPIGLYMSMTPKQMSYIYVANVNLITGEILSTSENYDDGNLKSSDVKKLMFNK